MTDLFQQINTFLIVAVCSISVAQAADNEYTCKLIDTPDGQDVFLTGINNLGHACGYTVRKRTTKDGKKGETQAILYRDGKMTYLGTLRNAITNTDDVYLSTLPNRSSKATAINDKGQIVGQSMTDGNIKRAFLWENGTMRELTELGRGESTACDINNAGCIVGEMQTHGRWRRAFSLYNGTLTNLGTLHGCKDFNYEASAVNDKFQIVGTAYNANKRTAFIYENKTMSVPPSITQSNGNRSFMAKAYDINNHGDIAGTVGVVQKIVGNINRAGIFKDGTYIVFGKGLHKTTDHATVITDSGIVLGSLMNDKVGCIWKPGEPRAIFNKHLKSENSLDIPFTMPPTGINQYGQIVGSGIFTHPKTRQSVVLGIIATPKGHDPTTVSIELPSAPVEDSSRRNLLFITHGFNSNADGWVSDLKQHFENDLSKRGELSRWDIIAHDWREASKPVERDALDPLGTIAVVEQAKQSGIVLGTAYSKRNYAKVHLIGHSAGSWEINEIARKINTKDCFVLVTFLDAYVPVNRVGNDDLGQYADFAEQYYDGHFNLIEAKTHIGETGCRLDYCFNKDLTKTNPNHSLLNLPWKTYISDHAWPYQWYLQSTGSGYGLDISVVLGNHPTHSGEMTRTGKVENQTSQTPSESKQSSPIEDQVLDKLFNIFRR